MIQAKVDKPNFAKVIMFLTLLTITLLGSAGNFGQAVSSGTLVLFRSYGLLYRLVDPDFEVPEGWNVLHVSSNRWYVESKIVPPVYELVQQLPTGRFTLSGNTAIFESGEVFVQTPFGLAKQISDGRTLRVLRHEGRAEALFSVPGGFRIYYNLLGDSLEQFFELRSPVERAFVILSLAPEEVVRGYTLAKAAAELAAPETTESGRKLIVLGNLEGLRDGINVRNKVMKVARRDWNKVDLAYTYSYDWRPADYVVELKTGEDLPAGELVVFSQVLGRNVPIGFTKLPDISKEGEVYVSKSWQVYHSWTLSKFTRSSGRIFVAGELNLRGQGAVKLVVRGKNISNFTIQTGTVIRSAADLVEVELNVSGVAKVGLSFSYAE